MPINGKPRAIELCAGTAILSSKLFELGFDVCAVDTKRNRFRVKFPITDLDLCEDDSVLLITEAIVMNGIAYIHAGVPCGTASRAREIPIKNNCNAPRPLRTETEPWGRTDITLSDIETAKLKSANRVYESVATIIKCAIRCGAVVSIENPERSLLWHLEPYKQLLEMGLEDTCFQQCAFGGGGPKKTRWRGTAGVFTRLSKMCPGESNSHKHLPWGMVRGSDGSKTFATAEEAAYPAALSVAAAESVRDARTKQGNTFFKVPLNPNFSNASDGQKLRAQGAGRSTMGKRPLPLVSEFASISYLSKGSIEGKKQKIIRELNGGDSIPDNHDGNQVKPDVVVGEYWTAEQFLQKALEAKHPVDEVSGIPKPIRDNISWLLENGPIGICKFRLHAIRELVKLVEDFKDEELELHKQWSDHRQRILGSKRMKVLEHLSKEISHPDGDIVSQACAGFNVVGIQPHSCYFQQQTVMAVATADSIASAAAFNNKRLISSCKSSGNKVTDDSAWELIEEEISKGWISQPVYSLREAEQQWPGLVISRRFPLKQGNKIRLIDDFNESNVNLAYTHSEKLSFHDIDVIAATIGCVGVSLKTSKLHADWAGSVPFRGRTLDLKAAYKQWAVSDDNLRFNVVCAWDPRRKEPALMTQYTLPFGAVSAVVNFNRLARLLWELLVRKLKLVVLNFYDDFPSIEPAATSGMALKAAETFLGLLGWAFAQQGEKSPPYAEVFTALGVVFCVSKLDSLLATVYNKQSRIEAISADIESFRQKRHLSKVERECLRGRLQFLERQVFGRLGKFLINDLCGVQNFPAEPCDWSTARDEAACNLLQWMGRLTPRSICPTGPTEPVVIFTDGAEGDVQGTYAACGAVCVDPFSGRREFFGLPIKQTLIDEWRLSGVTKIIAQAELLPVLLSMTTWAKVLQHRRVLVFVDNESAKFACINMWSPVLATQTILKFIAEWNLDNQAWFWYSRVASFSNPADPASRLAFSEVRTRFGAQQVKCEAPDSLINSKLIRGVFVSRFT